MNTIVRAVYEFGAKFKKPIIAALVALWLIIIIVVVNVQLKKSAAERMSAKDEERINNVLKDRGKIDKQLLSSGKILSSKDNTPIDKLYLYSKQQAALKEIELRKEMVADYKHSHKEMLREMKEAEKKSVSYIKRKSSARVSKLKEAGIKEPDMKSATSINERRSKTLGIVPKIKQPSPKGDFVNEKTKLVLPD